MKRIILIFLFLINLYLNITGTIRYVSKTGSSTPPYTTWATAADSIQKCINFSQIGDTIYVANGTYYEQVAMIPALVLIGSGMDSCVIDTRALAEPSDFMAVRVKESGSIEGFRIIVSNSRWGTGIFLRHSAGQKHQSYAKFNKISNANLGIWLDDNDQGVCGSNIIFGTNKGIRIANFWDSQPFVENNFISNFTEDGIAVTFGGNPIIRNNTIVDNNVTFGIFGGGPDSLFLENNLVLLNNSSLGAIALTLAQTYCENNIVDGQNNYLGIQGRSNNIIVNNSVTAGERGIYRFNGESPIIKYNNSWNNDVNYSNFNPDSTNLSVDPMFVDEENLDFHLQAFSPLIDAGDPSIIDIDGSRSDIGLYGGPNGESYLYIDLPPKAPRNILASLDSGIVNIRWNKNNEADLKYYNVYRDTVNNFILDSSKIIISTGDTSLSEPLIGSNNLYYKITAVDGSENESIPGDEVSIIVVGVNASRVVLEEYILYQNYPNPFNPTTTIGYKLSTEGYVKLNVYDIQGEKITELVNSFQNPGYYEVNFGGSDKGKGLASGIYLYKLEVVKNGIPVYSALKKMIQIK